MTDQSETFALPESWSIEDITKAWDITRDQINALIRDGKVGYYLGKNRQRRFFADHLAQIRAGLEVQPRVNTDVFSRIGVNPATAARLRGRSRRSA